MPLTMTGYQRSQSGELVAASTTQNATAASGSRRPPGSPPRPAARPRASHSRANGSASQAALTRPSVAYTTKG
ncbi:Uncharacterised protein [Achromobacter xylosoxidans]|uniref:hypothetical protein n=1 Tax=Alcaligenes xylosoxydans xylosoxydans TaxID=85698 RepID=UPI0006C41982|nr:hypothetical protein [Achromobacter xylosoxidans]CUI78663.1 Uncharacterised protein [Achromobacter xylosoxidans]CUJ10028.1 Uncharacterised protein [Achromobacter xylosoxidans]CUJ10092.1 Uncharacterised protein [Achromobacter xylosoxidans]CUJ20516.1 Uncharacterised protein [Achromobacter xylosoxidans]CUJ37061.1 Uncharacterised protein [Achromobacter xylosoxidans]